MDKVRAIIIKVKIHNGSTMIDNTYIQRAIHLAKDYGATRLILFGSALESPESARDLDLACDGVSGWKLYELGAKNIRVVYTRKLP